MAKSKIIVLTGATASGKTAFALQLAEGLGGEIVSADSMQVYRRLDIGTAKPTPAERARVPHHLIDVADPDEAYHVGRYRAEATRAIRQVVGRGRVPLVVGGTALYLKVLLEGLAPAPGRDAGVRQSLEQRWERGDAGALWEELRRVDPELAARIHPNDRTRVVRGLEVWRVTGRPLSDLQRAHRFSSRPFAALRLGLRVDREELYARIDRRVEEMLAAGWVEEVRGVLREGCPPRAPALQAIGYREIVGRLERGADLAGVTAEIQRSTRRYAKRQLTWFRRMDLAWLAPDALPAALARARKFLQTDGAPI